MKYPLFALLVLCPTLALAFDPAYKRPVNDYPETAGATMQEHQGTTGARSGEPPQAIATNPPGDCIQDEMLKRADWERRHQGAIDAAPEEDYYVKPTWNPETGALSQMIYSPNRSEGDNKPEYGYRIINGRLAPNADVNNRGPLLSPRQREEINAALAGSTGSNGSSNEQQLKVLAPRTMPAPSVAGAINGKTAATLPTGSVDHDFRATKSYISGRQKRKAGLKNTEQKEKEIQAIINGKLAPNSDVNNRGLNADLAGSKGYNNEQQVSRSGGPQQAIAQPRNTEQKKKEIQEKKIAASSDANKGSKPSANTGGGHFVCVPKCYVKQAPNANSPTVAELLEYDWVRVLKTKSGWCQVETGAGSVGWLNKNLIK